MTEHDAAVAQIVIRRGTQELQEQRMVTEHDTAVAQIVIRRGTQEQRVVTEHDAAVAPALNGCSGTPAVAMAPRTSWLGGGAATRSSSSSGIKASVPTAGQERQEEGGGGEVSQLSPLRGRRGTIRE